jgi:hypothetical protein
MKALAAFWLPVIGAVVFAMPATAGGFAAAGGSFGGRANALGGNPASRGASIRPLGGFAPGNQPGNYPGFGHPGHPNGGYPGRPDLGYPGRPGRYGRGPNYAYGYSFYVPNYYDGFDDGGAYAPSYGAAPLAPQDAYAPPPAPQQPVVINQYFGAQPLPQSNDPREVTDAQAAEGDVIGTPPNYYLIAYKNHAVYAALAYWVEDKTLHYVTTQNTHNQASLDLIDVTLTKSLNQSREVPFTLPGQ